MKFKRPDTGYTEEASFALLWGFLFGPIYYAYKGAWGAAIASFILAVITVGFSHLLFWLLSKDIVRKTYLRKGWVEV